MNLIKFVADAGSKILGLDTKNEKEVAAVLEQSIQDIELDIEDLSVEFKDGVATLHGTAGTQSDREKAVLVVGNHKGVKEVKDDLKVKQSGPEAKLHTVVKGDTLSKLAKTYYGDSMKYPIIFDANRPMLTDPNKIYPGQVLRIPMDLGAEARPRA